MHHPLGTLLLQEHMIKEEDLDRVERICSEFNCPFEDAVTRLDLLTPETIQVFKEHLPTLALSQLVDVDPNLIELLTAEQAHEFQCFPVASIGGTLTVALADPADKSMLRAISSATGRTVDAVPALDADLQQVIVQHYGERPASLPPLPEEGADSSSDAAPDPPQEGAPPSVPPAVSLLEEEDHPDHTRAEVVVDPGTEIPDQVKLANRLLSLAVVRSADRVEIRWKGDTESSVNLFDDKGRHGLAAVPPARAAQVIQRYRVLGDLLMASRKRPQEAVFTVPMKFEDGSVEERIFHVEIVPIGDLEGEAATITLADADGPGAGAVTGSEDPVPCPACQEVVIRNGFHYCPLCGVSLG